MDILYFYEKKLIGKNKYYLKNSTYKNGMNILDIRKKELNSTLDVDILSVDFLNFLMKKGNKSKALKLLESCMLLLRKHLYINMLLIIKVIIIKANSVMYLKKYFLGRKEKLVPKLVSLEKKNINILRNITKEISNIHKSDKKNILLVSLLDHFFDKSSNFSNNSFINEQARINKFEFLRDFKRRKRKYRIFRR